MVIDELHVFRSLRRPYKANPPLIVHPDRMLSLPVALEGLQPVSRRSPQIGQTGRCVQIAEPAPRDGKQISRKALRSHALERRAGPIVPEALDRLFMYHEMIHESM